MDQFQTKLNRNKEQFREVEDVKQPGLLVRSGVGVATGAGVIVTYPRNGKVWAELTPPHWWY